MDDIPQSEWINARSIKTIPKIIAPIEDKEVSKVVGKKVFSKDPKLINLIVKWKNKDKRSDDSDRPDNFMKNPEFIKELKKTFT